MENTENKQKNDSKKIIFSLILISILVLSVIGISFASFVQSQKGSKDNTISTGTISMTYTEDTNGISISNAFPMSDDVGKVLSGKNEYFDFTVNTKVSGNVDLIYEVAAVKDKASTLSDDDVKIYLEREKNGVYEQVLAPTKFIPLDKITDVGSPDGSMVLVRVTRNDNFVDNYRLRMWVSDSALSSSTSQTYIIKVNVYGKSK